MTTLFGSFYSNIYSTGSAVGGEDLITKVKASLANANRPFTGAKKMTIVSPTAITIDINNLGVYSTLWENADGDRVISFDAGDLLITSVKVQETSASNIYIAVVF